MNVSFSFLKLYAVTRLKTFRRMVCFVPEFPSEYDFERAVSLLESKGYYLDRFLTSEQTVIKDIKPANTKMIEFLKKLKVWGG